MEIEMENLEHAIILMASFSFLGGFIGAFIFDVVNSVFLYFCKSLPFPEKSIGAFEKLRDENFALSQELEILKLGE